MSDHWYLDDAGEPVQCDDVLEWAKRYERDNRTVAKDKVGEVLVSTVFLGLDHSFGHGPPLLFETMVFGGTMNEECGRYATRDESLAGHKVMLEAVRKAPQPPNPTGQ